MNRELYAEGAGLPYDEAAIDRLSKELAEEYSRAVGDPDTRDLALDGLAEALDTSWELRLADAKDNVLADPAIAIDSEAATWRNWKRVERSSKNVRDLRHLLDTFVRKSSELMPIIEGRRAARSQLYRQHGTTPLEVFARRERVCPDQLYSLALRLGDTCREPFQVALADLAWHVFGREEIGAAELHALYLNRMYEPLAPLFNERQALADVSATLGRLGFATEHIALDIEDRPKKYPGAFCFPVQIPGDVRISVRPVSPHHLTDMLFHEFGHASHFSSIDPALSYADRYWIHASTHETFSTLFESLLGLPGYLTEAMGFSETEACRLAAFDRLKHLLTGTWLAAAGATVCDAWNGELAWPEIEQRFAAYVQRFTGIGISPGLARLDEFVSNVDPYPLGYVVAAVRVAHWLNHLETEFGARWWTAAGAGETIREKMTLGGAVTFDDAWLDPAAFVQRWIATSWQRSQLSRRYDTRREV
ncbi:MAG TPA: hypothetical protein VJL59_07295 [Anaerolineales bacterium]|nr:hypothetical protein [Anaerolineales bacterium]